MLWRLSRARDAEPRLPVPAQAQSYPTKPITIVVPAAPGGVSDVMARLVAQRFTTAWGQQVIVENRGGANHAIGAAMVGRAAPDGHSMMVAAETVFVINPTLHAGKLPYDVEATSRRSPASSASTKGCSRIPRCRPTTSPN